MRTVKEIKELFRLFEELSIYETYGIKKLGVFGSFARGEKFHDIDLFIEEDLGYKQIADLKNKLETQTGIPFDIMLKKNAEPVILYRALKDMQYATTHAEKIGLRKYFISQTAKKETKKRKDRLKIIDEGVDVSNFGDASEWQRSTRKDRILP